MYDDLILVGLDEESAKRLAEAAAATGITVEALLSALAEFGKNCTGLADALKELGEAAWPATNQKQAQPRPPKCLGRTKYAAARPPARTVCHKNQRGRKR